MKITHIKQRAMLTGSFLQICSILINNIGLLSLKILLKENNFFVVTRTMNLFSFVILLLISIKFQSHIFNKYIPKKKVFILTLINVIGNSAFISAVDLAHPVYVALFGRSFIIFNIFFSVVVLKERLRKLEIPLIFFAVCGMIMFSHRDISCDQTVSLFAIFCIILYCLCFSMVFVLTQKWSSQDNYAGIVMLPRILTSLFLTLSLSTLNLPAFNWGDDFSELLKILLLLCVSATPIAAAALLFFKSAQFISFRLASMIRSLSPVVMYFLSFIIFPIKLSSINLLGASICIASLSLLMTLPKKGKA